MTREGFAPFAVDKNIPPGSNDPPIHGRIAILHVDAGNATSLYHYFSTESGGVEAHFFVRKDGVIEQYRSIYYQADANYHANDFAISIETQGYEDGEWNSAQIDGINRILGWLHTEIGLPLVKCTEWDGHGVGYHTQFGSPGAWTNVAKSCPGPDRIQQFYDVIVPGLAELERAIEEGDTAMVDDIHKRIIESLTRVEEMLKIQLGPDQEALALQRAQDINDRRTW